MRKRSLGVAVLLAVAVVALLVARWPGPGIGFGGDGSRTVGAGQPRAAEGMAIRLLANEGFTIGYAPARRSAVWVTYGARAIGRPQFPERPRFVRDARVSDAVDREAYIGSGFDRGHLAPNYLISNLYGVKAQRQSFRMSNIAPQLPRLNQLLWQRLEEIEADHMAPRLEALEVTVGPIFDDHAHRLPDGPAVPVAFYRLWLDRTEGGDLRVLALRVPQSVRGDERLDRFVVSVDRIEAETGLDFYSELSNVQQQRIESTPADPAVWGLTEKACMPARYADNWRGRNGVELDFDRCRAAAE